MTDTATGLVVGDLTADERAALTAGADLWHTTGVARLGVAAMGVTDGPSGARGSQFTGTTSLSFPCGTALAATWNRALIGRVGRVIAEEARSKGAHVLLAPTVNLHRHPLGGRNFECYSEDPFLTAELAVAYIEGVQGGGAGCAVKHFAFNDQETDRMTIDVVVDERTRRELYLAPFEAAVRRAGVWVVMAAYNRVDGLHCSENADLLTTLLRDEWGFDGVVISDWFGVQSVRALAAGLDLEMPGPATALGPHLVDAVERKQVSQRDVDRAAQRVLDLAARTGQPPTTPAVSDPVAVATQAATEAIVLLANDGVLPLDPAAPDGIAVLGWRADDPEIQGGGSAQVTPPYVVTPLRGIVDRVARAAAGSVVYEAGRPARGATIRGDVRYDYYPAGSLAGRPLATEILGESAAFWIGEPAPGVPAGEFSARLTAPFTPDVSGRWVLTVSGAGTARLFLDGELLADTVHDERGAGLVGLFTAPHEVEVDLDAGAAYEVTAELDAPEAVGPIQLAGITVEARPPAQVDAFDRALRAAAAADVAVVVVGVDARETEGVDGTTMDLPADQVDLIRQVAARNPRTVVVVNTASPVTMDWADDVAAVVQMSYLGQETGTALAAVLFGDADAAGRLTTTFPRRLDDCPAHGNFPGTDDTVTYAEGLLVGYRHFDTNDVEPRWCFGHGLSYTTFDYSHLTLDGDNEMLRVTVDVTNTGGRAGSEVVQVYVRDLDAPVLRPYQELKGFHKVALEAGDTARVTLELDRRAFAYWSTARHAWQVDAGAFEVAVGSSSRDIRSTARWTIDESTDG